MVNIIEVDMLMVVPIKPIKPPIIAKGITLGIMESKAILMDLNMKPINNAINKNAIANPVIMFMAKNSLFLSISRAVPVIL